MLITFQGHLSNINLPCFNIQLTDTWQLDRVLFLGTPLNEMPFITHDPSGMYEKAKQPTLNLCLPLMGVKGDTLEPQKSKTETNIETAWSGADLII